MRPARAFWNWTPHDLPWRGRVGGRASRRQGIGPVVPKELVHLDLAVQHVLLAEVGLGLDDLHLAAPLDDDGADEVPEVGVAAVRGPLQLLHVEAVGAVLGIRHDGEPARGAPDGPEQAFQAGPQGELLAAREVAADPTDEDDVLASGSWPRDHADPPSAAPQPRLCRKLPAGLVQEENEVGDIYLGVLGGLLTGVGLECLFSMPWGGGVGGK